MPKKPAFDPHVIFLRESGHSPPGAMTHWEMLDPGIDEGWLPNLTDKRHQYVAGEVSLDDKAWFKAHPQRLLRLRRLRDGEAPIITNPDFDPSRPADPGPEWIIVLQVAHGFRCRFPMNYHYPPLDTDEMLFHSLDDYMSHYASPKAKRDWKGIRRLMRTWDKSLWRGRKL